MTLILSCITGEHAFQVSDRRLTRSKSDGSIEVIEDDRNKAVAFDGRLSWAFTGLAQVGREPAAEWLAKWLNATSEESLSELGRELARHATDDFKRIRLSSKCKRHAFVAVGWWPLASNPCEFQPVIVTISNAIDGSGNWQATASDTFRVMVSEREEGLKLLPAGQRVSAERLSRLRRNLRASSKRGALCASGDLLVREVRRTAAANQRVGATVLLISLPRAALEESGRFTFINQRPSQEVATYWYLSSSDDAQRSPIIVGRSMISNVVIHRGKAAQREMRRLQIPRPTPPRFLILTTWTGTGLEGDARRGTVTEYGLDAWTDLTRALSWDKECECPYFGLILGANASDTIIQEIRADERHVILADTQRSAHERVSDELIIQLENWFVHRGATRDDLDVIDLQTHREDLRTLFNRLLAVMRTPRRGHEGTKLHQPQHGTGAGVAVGRKYKLDPSAKNSPRDS